MTRKETIEELKDNIKLYTPLYGDVDRDTPDGRLITALEMAIQALSQEPTKREIEREYLFQSLCEDFKKLQAENDDLRKRLEQEPCTDAVSREAVLDETIRKNSIWNSITNSEGKNLEEIIFELPPVNPQPSEHFIDGVHAIGYREGYKDAQKQKSGKWIPVSKRLPEDGTYLVTVERIDGEPRIDIKSFTKDLNKVDEFDFPKHKCGWYDYDSEYGYWQDASVRAWMPLPKPYDPQESEAQE